MIFSGQKYMSMRRPYFQVVQRDNEGEERHQRWEKGGRSGVGRGSRVYTVHCEHSELLCRHTAHFQMEAKAEPTKA